MDYPGTFGDSSTKVNPSAGTNLYPSPIGVFLLAGKCKIPAMQIKSFKEANKILRGYIPAGHSMRGAYTLERMQKLMEELGNPQENYKTIHIAGTSGKTSTAYYISAFLKAAGKKAGLTISPHIDEINERVQLNLSPMAEADFCRELGKFISIVNKLSVKPTYFELMVAFAYWEFAEAKVDYAVVEVGLGGLLDGTNVVKRPDKICVITDIGLDHTEVLGKTLTAITAQKAGIIHPHNPVMMYQQSDEIMEIVREVADQQQSELHEIIKPVPSELPKNLPLFQRRNWYLGSKVYGLVAWRDKLPALTAEQLKTTAKTYVPARMEIVESKDKTIIMDGAHNAQKMKALISSFKDKFPGVKTATMLSMTEHRKFPLEAALKQVLSISDHLIITTFYLEQEVHKEPLNPLRLAEICARLGFTDIEIIEDPEEAFRALMKRPEKHLLITGSFYLLNHIRPHLKKS